MSAAPATDATFEALHRVRVRGLAPADALGDVTGLVDRGLLLSTERGCLLTPDGLAEHERLLIAWREQIDLEGLAQAYERFLAVNQEAKDRCSAWQAGPQDEEALFLAADALGDVQERVAPALARAGRIVPRFTEYAAQIEAALERAAEGDARFITDPRVASVHTVWFACHEDFLVSLGRDREEEGSF